MEILFEVLKNMKPAVDVDTFDNAQDLFGEGILDSLDILNLIKELEEVFHIMIDFENLSRKDFMTISNIGEMVRRHGVQL